MSLPDLPPDLLSRILGFLGTVPDLLHCEQTCLAVRRVMENNDNAAFWILCPGATDEYEYTGMSHRERASVHYVTNVLIYKEQRQTDNIFESVLGIPLWISVVQFILRHQCSFMPSCSCIVHIRGDASFVLMEMIQQSLITQFERGISSVATQQQLNHDANISCPYPVLTESIMAVQGTLQIVEKTYQHSSWLHCVTFNQSMWPIKYELTGVAADLFTEFPDLTPACTEKIIRRIASRAGVVKLSNEVYNKAWESALSTIWALLSDACYRLFHFMRTDENDAAVLHSNQRIRDVMPFPRVEVTTVNLFHTKHYVLVPKLLEDAGRPLVVVPLRIYGDGWHVVDPNLTREQEIDQALAMYDFEQDHNATGEGEFEWDLESDRDMDDDDAALLEVSDDDDDVSWASDESENEHTIMDEEEEEDESENRDNDNHDNMSIE